MNASAIGNVRIGDRDSAHTLVVVFLRGGADGLNMVAPFEDDAYYHARPRLGLAKGEVLRLDERFGFNEALAPLERPFRDGALAIVHGAGSDDQTRSHFEAQDLMEHGGDTGGGWLGRYLRFRPAPAMGPLDTVAFGKASPECLRGAPSTVVMESFDTFDFGAGSVELAGHIQALYAGCNTGLGDAAKDTLVAMEQVRHLRNQDYVAAHGAAYGASPFAQGLLHIAQLIKARVGLQAATVDLPGWDSHFAQTTLMNPLMSELADGLSAFYQDLGKDMDRVTVVAMTEFGRRVYENASYGTDHGRGSIMVVMGGGVRGGRVLADWQGLEDSLLEPPGDLPVTTDYRDVLSVIVARHGGVKDLDPVFPGHQVNPVDLY